MLISKVFQLFAYMLHRSLVNNNYSETPVIQTNLLVIQSIRIIRCLSYLTYFSYYKNDFCSLRKTLWEKIILYLLSISIVCRYASSKSGQHNDIETPVIHTNILGMQSIQLIRCSLTYFSNYDDFSKVFEKHY